MGRSLVCKKSAAERLYSTWMAFWWTRARLASATGAAGLPPRDCLGIEDAPAGIHAAHVAGSRAIGVTTTFSAAELAEAGLVVPELSHFHLTVIAPCPIAPLLLSLIVS